MTRSSRPRRTSTVRFRSALDEHEREESETGFTLVLRGLFLTQPALQAVVFVDNQGECVDYCSAIPPFEAKVSGAHAQILMASVRRFMEAIDGGEPAMLELHGSKRDVVVRRLGEQYLVGLLLNSGGVDQTLLHGLDQMVSALRDEAAIEVPSWDPQRDLEVETRSAIGWPFAPSAYSESGHVRRPIKAVLGRWEEHGGLSADHLVCFRVLDEEGVELTLAYDIEERRWMRW